MQSDTTKQKGILFIISGPSGAGKSTVRKEVFKKIPDLVYSISCTTRKKRPGEIDGVDYRFISKEKFFEYVKQNRFLEWAQVHGNYYGTLKEDVEKELKKGNDVVLEIDVQGAEQVKSIFPDSVLIFIMPPSFKELEERLKKRGTEDEKDLQKRLENSKIEMKHVDMYDYAVINDDLNKAVNQVINIIQTERIRKKGGKK